MYGSNHTREGGLNIYIPFHRPHDMGERAEDLDDQEHVPLPSSFYASTEDPKPKHQNFRVGGGGGGRKPLCIYFSFLK